MRSAAESRYEDGPWSGGGGPIVNGLEERRARAVATAARLSRTATVLLDAAAELRSRAHELRTAASETRFRASFDDGTMRVGRVETNAWFTVRGIVDGRPATARWSPGNIECDDELRQRIQVVVAMGEQFFAPWSPETSLPASVIEPPVSVLLTVMRAFSRVTAIDLHDELLESLDSGKPP
jgi:hypothetical protein